MTDFFYKIRHRAVIDFVDIVERSATADTQLNDFGLR